MHRETILFNLVTLSKINILAILEIKTVKYEIW